MTDLAGFAASIAGDIDAATISIHPASRPAAVRVLHAAGLDRGGLLVGLLVPLLAGPADIAALHSIERYAPPDRFTGALDEHVAQGMLIRSADSVRATPAGRELLLGIRQAQGAAITSLWADRGHAVTALEPLADRVLAAVIEPGTAFVLMTPPAAAASPAHALHDRITALRYHRADAHATAWTAAGLTAESVQALGAGPAAERLEAATNQLAARPYEILTDNERGTFAQALKNLATLS